MLINGLTQLQVRRTSWFKRTAYALLAVCAVLVLAVYYFTATSSGLQNLAGTISRIATNADGKVEIRGISNIWFGTTRIEGISLSDASGVYATITEFEADWSRSALLGFRFSAQSTKVKDILIERIPESKNSSDKPFSLPLEIEINSFSVSKISLGKELVATGADLSLSGKIRALVSPVDISATVLSERLDRKGDTALLEIAYQPTKDRLEADLSYVESANGILANLLAFPVRPDLALSAKATGSLSDLKVNVVANAGKKKILNLDGKLHRQGDSTRLIVTGVSEPTELVPLDFKELLAGEILLDLDISRTDLGSIQIAKALIDTDTFYGAATGSFDPAGQSNISGGFTAKNAAINLLGGIVPGTQNFAPKSIAFNIVGPAANSKIEMSIDVPLIDMNETKLLGIKGFVVSKDFNFSQSTGTFVLDAEAASVLNYNSDIAELLKGKIKLTSQGSINRQDVSWNSLILQNEALKLQSAGKYDLVSKAVLAELQSTISVRSLPKSLSGILGDTVDLSAKLNMSDTGAINISDIDLNGGSLGLEGSALLSKDDINAGISFSLSKLSSLSQSADGNIQGILNLNGSINAPKIDLVVSSNKITLDDHLLSDLQLKVAGIVSRESPDLTVLLSGAIDNLPLIGGASVKLSDGKRMIDAIEIKNGMNRLTGSLILDDAAIPSGNIRFDLENLGTLAALTLQKIEGKTSGIVTLSNNNGKAVADVSVVDARITREDLSLSDLTANIKIEDYLNSPVISGNASVENITSGNTQLVSTRLQMVSDEGWTRFDVSSNIDRNLPLEATGRMLVKNGRTMIELNTATANVQSVPVVLAAPTNVAIENGITRISNAVLEISGGQATINGNVGSTLDIKIALAKINATLANQFATDLRAGGLVSGPISINGTPASPDVKFDLNWQDATTSQLSGAGLGRLDIDANGSYANKLLRITTALSGSSGIDFKGGGNVALDGAPVLDLAFNGTLPFSILAPTLNENGVSLTGNAIANITVAGRSDNPSINGEITSQEARFVHADSGIAINDISLGVDFVDGQARIRQLAGKLSSGGNVNVSGTVGIQGQQGFPADIKIVAKDAVYADGKTVNTKLDAVLKLTGSLINNPLLSGKVDLQKTVITVPDKIPDSVSKLNVQHKNASVKVEQQAESFRPKISQTSSGISLDLQINAANQIFVRGRGIDAELGGALRLSGGLNSPLAQGSFDLRRGRLSILGKRLDFTSGTITFSGSLVPELNLKAETQSDNVTITVSVTGPADSPEFSFSSVPALAEDEVLARLIFNRNIANLSPLQIVQLGQAVATLTGAGGNSSLLDKFQKLIKVDDLDVRTDSETGETTVGVGSYVNDKTYIAVERGNSPGTGKATIDLNIGRGVKLRGEATETGKNKAGIFFEREY